MTGPENYREAERLIAYWATGDAGVEGESAEVLAAATVHATLALAMATALGEQETEYKNWLRVNAGGEPS